MVFPPAPCAPAQIYAILPNSRVRRIEKSRGLGECEHEAGVAEVELALRWPCADPRVALLAGALYHVTTRSTSARCSPLDCRR